MHSSFLSTTALPHGGLPEPASALLAACPVQEEAFALAYESAGPQVRAEIKLALARLFALWGKAPQQRETVQQFAEGFQLREECAPAPFTVVLCPVQFAQPACLVASLMPALCAGVPHVLPVFVGEEAAVHPYLLCALELAGVEGASLLSLESAEELLGTLCAGLGQGRLLVLGPQGFGLPILQAALGLNLPAMPLWGVPRTTLLDLSAHSKGTGGASTFPHCGPFMQVDAANSSVWLWPGLEPQWFINKRVSLLSD
ncbi:histidinol dehydrogenase [Desulfovibrio cuneatus]|uniref:histidinol dehydrogenase n=1 Tax=Desulfovibrio cuneatus TaxID=159728 RepID=UPI0003F63C03|nr:histidinol dehydrogenase [Desulfovibrio cuneatus]